MKLKHITEMSQILNSFDINDFVIINKKLNLYQTSNGKYSEIWFIVFNKDHTEIDFIVKFKQDAIKVGKNMIPVIVPFFTYKPNNKIHGLVSKVYKQASNQLKRPILSDKQQSTEMIDIWINFYENKSKYSIKFAEFIDSDKNSIMTHDDLATTEYGVHNYFEKGQRYRIIIDFNNTSINNLKENMMDDRVYFKGYNND